MTLHKLQLKLDDGVIPLCIAAPISPGPLLVIVPSIFGLSPDVLAFATRFQAAGALVMAFNPFWRQSAEPIDIETSVSIAIQRKNQHTESSTLSDLDAVLKWGKKHSMCDGRALALGICFGGRFAFQAASFGWVDAAAAWHGGGLGKLLNLAESISVPLSMDFGAADPLIPLSEVDQIQSAFSSHSSVDLRIHADSGHGFSHLGTSRCNPKAAERAAQGVEALIEHCRR